jgi:glyoxylate reductase
VSNTPGAVDASTANTAIFLLLGAMRRVHVPATSLRAGQWRGHMSLGHDPDGKILGILGMGGIGSAVARRALAFDFKLQYHNRSPLPSERNPWGAVYVDFETLLRTSDVISVHLPLGDDTKGMIGEKEFKLMKKGVVLVNTARGAIIDEQALVCAVQSGKVFGAGLDVYEKEPEVSQELLDNENVVLLPHLGTATVETQVRLQ